MPKVYISQEQRERELYRRRIKSVIKGRTAELGLKQKHIAEALGLTQAAVSIALNNGSLSMFQMIKLDTLLHFTPHEFEKLFGRTIERREK